jgi:hypothetical protein
MKPSSTVEGDNSLGMLERMIKMLDDALDLTAALNFVLHTVL